MRDTRLPVRAVRVLGDERRAHLRLEEGRDRFTKRNMRRMVAGAHDDLSHAGQTRPTPRFSNGRPTRRTAKVADAHVARMMYDVYGLVEAKDLTKNVKNLWKKKWSTVKKGEMAVTMLFLAAGIAISICTMGAGLPVMALVGIAAAKTDWKEGRAQGSEEGQLQPQLEDAQGRRRRSEHRAHAQRHRGAQKRRPASRGTSSARSRTSSG